MLDPRLLRAFVAIADHRSFTGAATALNMTQSTISQQLARLEQGIGGALVDRAARPVLPTPAGERLLGHARRILALHDEAERLLTDPAGTHPVRIGMPDDIASHAMTGALAAFAGQHRDIRLDVTIGLSRELTRRYHGGELDIVVVKEARPGPDHRISFAEPMAWYEGSAAPDWPDPIPLVAFPAGGLYRDEMFARIEREGRRWYVALTSSSLSSVLVAVETGMGISLLPCRSTLGRDLRIHAPLGREQPMAVSLYGWETAGPVGELAERMIAVLAGRDGAAGG